MNDPPLTLPPTIPVSRDRFGLGDVMILVATLAFGLGWLRMESRQEVGWTFYTPYSSISSNRAVVSSVLEMPVPIVGSLTLGLALIRLRRPGRFSGSLSERPGFLACLSASVAVVLYLVRRSASALTETWLNMLSNRQFASSADLDVVSGRLLGELAYPAGVAVLATWVVARLGPPRGVRPGGPTSPGDLLGSTGSR